MEEIVKLLEIDFHTLMINLFALFAGLIATVTLVEKAANKLGVELKWQRKKREEHQLLQTTACELAELKRQQDLDRQESVRHDQKIEANIDKLTNMFIDKEIDDLRWEIINTADKLVNGRTISKECYKHCLRAYDKYEKIIETNNLTNSEVDMSIRIIRKSYLEQDYKD